ncbi:pilus assembly protein TadG-related protein [Aquibium oceanicum]|uniref:Putative Flp pilus-assembly TadG-like N-terminal domain-containing protein n=1 Tax=Aquibium oceanicum TaxID=1670800 RepID=A0A1L3SRI5_9HYPH|nr:pilus assembly protein TadG-related protein [Aquibium oceanicum]APH72037.1 hypothetical protein BSQ44_12185 [Aquibium oceanicum]
MLASSIGRLVRDRSGNFGIMAAFAMVPLVLGAGVAIDFSSLSNRKAELQNALDAAALAVAREGKTISDAEANLIAQQFIRANFDPKDVDLDLKRTGTRVTIKGGLRQKLAFAGLIGYDTAKVGAESSADIAYNKYEIALVLDTTGSMKGGKLSSMKDAVLGLVDTMSTQIKDADKLKFAVVPFANFVNVGNHFGPEFDKNGKLIKKTGADWLDLKGGVEVPQLELKKGVSRFEVMHNLKDDWKGCVETRFTAAGEDYDVSDEPTKKWGDKNRFVPAFSIDEPDSGYGNSYIASSVDPLDKSATAQNRKLLKYGVTSVTGSDGTTIPISGDGEWFVPAMSKYGGKGPNRDCVTQPIVSLNNDYNGIKNKVKSLQANGTTNIMEGVAWGMRVLSPHEPFSEGRVKEPGVEKIMIVLTDGSNVFGNNYTALRSSYSSNGYLVDGRIGIANGSSSDTNKIMNEKTLAACGNAKKDGIIVYTIRLEEPDVKTGMMLKDCATSPAHFFDAPSRSQLDEVFQKIRENVVRLRISS